MRFKPSFAAAPFGPPITQPTASSVRRIRVRSEFLSVVARVRNANNQGNTLILCKSKASDWGCFQAVSVLTRADIVCKGMITSIHSELAFLVRLGLAGDACFFTVT